MARFQLPRELESAFTAMEMLVTAGIFVLVLGAAVVGFGSVTHTARAAAFAEAGKAAAQAVVDALSRDCASAIACFTPANDVGNHSNRDGHEVAFYTRDAHGTGKFWSYCYKAKGASNCAGTPAANTVTLYGPYAWSSLPQNGGAGVPSIGAVASNITGFATSTITASQLVSNTVNPLTAGIFVQAGYTSIVNVQRQTGYPGVLAGNNVTIVRIATQGLTREVHLLAGVRPTHVTTVIGQITPPPNALTTIGSGTNYAWTNPLGAATNFGVAESNYGTRTTTPPQIYSTSSNTCTSYLKGTANRTLAPVSDGTGDAGFTLGPQIKTEPAGVNCQVVYADNQGQAASFHFTVGQTFVPTAAAGAGSYYNTATLVFTVNEGNYEPPAAGGGFTAATSGACGAPALASDSFTGGTYNAIYNVAGSGHGTCTLNTTDAYGQHASTSTQVIAKQLVCSTDPSAGTTSGDVEYDATNAEPPCAAALYVISVTPQTLFTNVNPGTAVYWTGEADITNPVQSPGSPANSPVTIANRGGNCGFVNPGWINPGGGNFGAYPNAYSVACSAQVVDQNNDAPVTITIDAATPAPTPAPTCPPGFIGTPPSCIQQATPAPDSCTVSTICYTDFVMLVNAMHQVAGQYTCIYDVTGNRSNIVIGADQVAADFTYFNFTPLIWQLNGPPFGNASNPTQGSGNVNSLPVGVKNQFLEDESHANPGATLPTTVNSFFLVSGYFSATPAGGNYIQFHAPGGVFNLSPPGTVEPTNISAGSLCLAPNAP